MGKGWLKCQISKGMFPNERAVHFDDAYGKTIDMFCQIYFLEGDKMNVDILDKDQSLVVVRLPAEPFNSGHIVAVHNSLVTEATVAA